MKWKKLVRNLLITVGICFAFFATVEAVTDWSVLTNVKVTQDLSVGDSLGVADDIIVGDSLYAAGGINSGAAVTAVTSLNADDCFLADSLSALGGIYSGAAVTAVTSINAADGIFSDSVEVQGGLYSTVGIYTGAAVTAVTSLNADDCFLADSLSALGGIYSGVDVTAVGAIKAATGAISTDLVVTNDLRIDGMITVDGTTEQYMSGTYSFNLADPDSNEIIGVFKPKNAITLVSVEAFEVLGDTASITLLYTATATSGVIVIGETDSTMTAYVPYQTTVDIDLAAAQACTLKYKSALGLSTPNADITVQVHYVPTDD